MSGGSESESYREPLPCDPRPTPPYWAEEQDDEDEDWISEIEEEKKSSIGPNGQDDAGGGLQPSPRVRDGDSN
jgi:hypothetical protein